MAVAVDYSCNIRGSSIRIEYHMDFPVGHAYVYRDLDYARKLIFHLWHSEYQNTLGMKLRNAESGVEPVDIPAKALDHDRSVNI